VRQQGPLLGEHLQCQRMARLKLDLPGNSGGLATAWRIRSIAPASRETRPVLLRTLPASLLSAT
jgi:hypothetical protein